MKNLLKDLCHEFALVLVRDGIIGANTYNAICDYLYK